MRSQPGFLPKVPSGCSVRPNGSTLRSPDLIGARLQLEGGAWVRIDGVHRTGDAAGRSWWAHDLSAQAPGGTWQPLCAAHADGTRYAIVLPGRQQADGVLADVPGAFALSCTTGALPKCLRMGYQPWQQTAGGRSMRATFNACVRMVRADYSGQGMATTENGRQIDVHDVHGIQAPDRLPEHEFEAGWDENGAVCVHHVRVPANVSPAVLEAKAPRLVGHIGEICTEAHARDRGALILNRSVVWR